MGAVAARGTMYPRFFFVLVGFALLIGIRGAFVSGAWVVRLMGASEAAAHRAGAVIAAIAIVVSALSVPLNWRTPKQDFVGAMEYVEREARPGDRIAMSHVTNAMYGRYYSRPWLNIQSADELEAARRGLAGGTPSRVWLLYTFPRYLEGFNAELASYVRRECDNDRLLRFRGSVGDGDVLVCRLEPS
jgi:hypothetical protein